MSTFLLNAKAKENTQKCLLRGLYAVLMLVIGLNSSFSKDEDQNQLSPVVTVTKNAYQAYAVRKLVIDAIMATHDVRTQLVDQWHAKGHYDDKAIKGLMAGQSIDTVTGVVTIDLTTVSGAFQEGDVVALHPENEAGFFTWQCRSNVSSNKVPGSCQK